MVIDKDMEEAAIECIFEFNQANINSINENDLSSNEKNEKYLQNLTNLANARDKYISCLKNLSVVKSEASNESVDHKKKEKDIKIIFSQLISHENENTQNTLDAVEADKIYTDIFTDTFADAMDGLRHSENFKENDMEVLIDCIKVNANLMCYSEKLLLQS